MNSKNSQLVERLIPMDSERKLLGTLVTTRTAAPFSRSWLITEFARWNEKSMENKNHFIEKYKIFSHKVQTNTCAASCSMSKAMICDEICHTRTLFIRLHYLKNYLCKKTLLCFCAGSRLLIRRFGTICFSLGFSCPSKR